MVRVVKHDFDSSRKTGEHWLNDMEEQLEVDGSLTLAALPPRGTEKIEENKEKKELVDVGSM